MAVDVGQRIMFESTMGPTMNRDLAEFRAAWLDVMHAVGVVSHVHAAMRRRPTAMPLKMWACREERGVDSGGAYTTVTSGEAQGPPSSNDRSAISQIRERKRIRRRDDAQELKTCQACRGRESYRQIRYQFEMKMCRLLVGLVEETGILMFDGPSVHMICIP